MTRLFLQTLTLGHFRSHRRLDLALDGQPLAIFGANGAGKTNILEAVSLLSPGRGLRRASAQDMVRKPDAPGWKISAILHGQGQLHEVEISWQPPSRTTLIDAKPAPQVALGRIARILWLVPAMDRLWLEGAEGRRRFLDRMTMSFEPRHAEAVLAYEKAMRDRNRLLRDGGRDSAWYNAVEAQMAAAGASIHLARKAALTRLRDAQQGAQTSFPVADLSLSGPDGARPDWHSVPDSDLVPALAGALAVGRGRDMAAGRTLVGPHRADLFATYAAKSMPARACSTGEQKALLISLILANARALASEIGAAPILLLDEVAAHLDAPRRAALFDEICALGAQAWMTGTGPELFDGLRDRATFLEVHDHDGASLTTKDTG